MNISLFVRIFSSAFCKITLSRCIRKYRTGGNIKNQRPNNLLQINLKSDIHNKRPQNKKRPSGYKDHDRGKESRKKVQKRLITPTRPALKYIDDLFVSNCIVLIKYHLKK